LYERAATVMDEVSPLEMVRRAAEVPPDEQMVLRHEFAAQASRDSFTNPRRAVFAWAWVRVLDGLLAGESVESLAEGLDAFRRWANRASQQEE
jgi:hypothetical protein